MKIHKKWLTIVLAFLGVAAVGAYYFWQEVTAVPDWYATEMNAESETETNNIKKVKTEEENFSSNFKPENSHTQPRETTPTQQEFNQIINRELSESPRTKPFLEASEGVQMKIEKDSLEMGTVIQPSAISTEEIKGSEKTIIERAINSFPGLNKQSVYVGISGNFQVDANGKLILNEDTKFRIGNMHLSLEEVSRRLGVSPEAVQQKLQANLEQVQLENQDHEE